MERGAHDFVVSEVDKVKAEAISEYQAAEVWLKKYFWIGYPIAFVVGVVVGHFVL